MTSAALALDEDRPVPASRPVAKERTLLIYAPVPLFERDGGLLLEEQACNGLRLWAENFDRLLVMMPVEKGPAPANWVPIEAVGSSLNRIEIHPLPTAYRADRFFRHLPETRRRIRALIARADYLSFAIGGLFGDWGAVSCLTADKMGRPFAVWTDRVESDVVRRTMHSGPWRRRIGARLFHRPMAWLERFVIRKASLGLFHGKETFDTYAPFCRMPEIVHDIHIARESHIPAEALARKVAAAGEGPLRIFYVGRADAMKGPLDWVEVMIRLGAAGVDFQATWLGDGKDRPEMLRRIAEAGLADRVALPGFSSDHDAVIAALREAHLFLFCHKTPESPRCLIEALVSGCPIIGYDSAFSRDLVSGHGGGLLTPLNDVGALAETVAALAADRARVADLIARAARDGDPYDDVSVFRHRSELIKDRLPFPR